MESAVERATDEELVAIYVRQGYLPAIEEIIRRYSPLLRRLVFTLVGRSSETAQDAEQEVFVTLVRKIGTFRGGSRFSTFFYRIARNRIVDLLRGEHRRATRTAPFVDELPEERRPGPEELTLRNEQADTIRIAMRCLPAGDRVLLYLKDAEGHSVAQLAALAKLSQGAVKSRLARARKRVAQRLEELGYE